MKNTSDLRTSVAVQFVDVKKRELALMIVTCIVVNKTWMSMIPLIALSQSANRSLSLREGY